MEARRRLALANNGDEVVPTCFDDEVEEESIDTSHLGLQDMEMMQNRDPFMYHTIIQEIRKRKLSALDSTLEYDADDGNEDEDEPGGQGLGSPDAAAGNAQSSSLQGDTSVANSNDYSTQVSVASQDRALSSARQQRRQSQSLNVPATSSRRHHRRLSQSFTSFSTGVVKRKRRISAESNHSLEMAELALSIRSSVTSDIADLDRMFGLDNNDNDQNDLNLSAMTLE